MTQLPDGWRTALTPLSEGPAVPDQAQPEIGPLGVGESFGTRYHIIRLLGAGGMGAVYQAWDAELGVAVAIKVIRPSIMANPSTAAEVERRFKRELLLARQVTHRNVVRIHDLGEINGIKYITMSYVNGADLATRLRLQGKQSVAETLRIARSVVSGLVAAHAAGVVHRDLKPANIMIGTDGDALIMDFGIAYSPDSGTARAAGPATPFTLERGTHGYAATVLGTVVGTVEYMAPEQARALPVDQRADIYAFGMILYELLLGPRPRHTRPESAITALMARMEHPPRPAREIDPDIPEALDRLVRRCLQPDPEKRFATTAELAAELARLDDKGEVIHEARRLTPRLMATVALVVALLLGGTYFVTREAVRPPQQHDPVSVIIADLDNRTNDPAFDRTLEPILRRALEGAGFVTAYDRSVLARTGVSPPDKLNEAAAQEIAVKQGLGVVLAGSIEPQRRGYRISITATETVTGATVATVDGTASNKDEVLDVATRLVASVRTALGDETSESAQIFAMASLSATSLDVVRHYAAAQEASSNAKFEEARASLLKAVELDPKFGVGYQLLAVAARNLGNLQEADNYINEAVRLVGTMTERERLSTRGFYYRVTGAYQECVREYGDLVARYAADITGRNQLALCLTQLRNFPPAVEHMQAVVNILPKRVLFRDNLSFYASYAGDFARAEKEARAVEEPDPYALLALGFAQLGQRQFPQAAETYRRLAAMNERGASLGASALGDLAALQGQFSDAVRILEEGVTRDLAAKRPDSAAAKLIAIAHTEQSRGRARAALVASEAAMMHSQALKIRFMAARTFIEAGDVERARPIIAQLSTQPQLEPRAYAKILEGNILRRSGNARQAITVLQEANTLLDTWIGHFDLGRAHLEDGSLIAADSAFDRCIKRSGESLSLFLDEEPTFAYFPAVFYHQGRIRQELKTEGFADAYRTYLGIRGQSKEDPFVKEARAQVNP